MVAPTEKNTPWAKAEITGAERCGAIAEDEETHQAEQERLALDAAGQCGKDGCTKGNTECVDGHNETGKRQRDVKIVGDGGQKTHDDEFRCADCIGCNRQGKKSKGHGCAFPATLVAVPKMLMFRA